MSKLFIMLVMFFSLLSSPIVFADSQEEIEMKCRAQADDKEITKDELDEFMKECVVELTEAKK